MIKLLSIIVPVYNVEKYLRRCIFSIVNQEVSCSEYELIVVNDGSTDTSRDILTEIKKEYPFIKIIDKENGGLSSARNAGLDIAEGEYIYFIDSDDWICNDSLQFIINHVKNYPADIHLFGAQEVYDNKSGKKLLSSLSSDNQILTISEYLNTYTLRSSAWQGIFKRELFTRINYSFKDGFIGEDDDFVVRIFSIAKNIVCNSKIIYFYYQRPNSISKSSNNSQNEKLITDKLLMLEELDIYIQSIKGDLKKGLQRKLDYLAVDIIRHIIRKKCYNLFVEEALVNMHRIGYFPLPKAKHSIKYTVFSKIFSRNWVITTSIYLKKLV